MFKHNRFTPHLFIISFCLLFTATSTFASSYRYARTGMWSIGADALYLKPSFGGNGLGYTTFSNYGNDIPGNLVDVNGATNHMSNMNPQTDWGFRIEGAYYLDPCNDLNLNWSHLNETTEGTLPLGTLFAGSASGLYAGQIKVETQWDTVNLEYGHRVLLDASKILRLHAGLSYVRIDNSFSNYPRLTPSASPLFHTHDTMKYWGIGPRFGGDFDYNLFDCFSIYLKAAGSLLTGPAEQSVNGYGDFVFAGSTYPYSTGNYNQSHSNVVVPEFEAKIGVTYDYAFSLGTVGFDLGYLWMAYLNAIVSQVGADVYSSAISASTTTNFDLSGLYFGIKWTGN